MRDVFDGLGTASAMLTAMSAQSPRAAVNTCGFRKRPSAIALFRTGLQNVRISRHFYILHNLVMNFLKSLFKFLRLTENRVTTGLCASTSAWSEGR